MTVADLTRCLRTARTARPARARLMLLLALAACAAGPQLVRAAEPHEIDARIVWSGATRVFVASRAADALEAGARLTFVRGREVVATGTIERVLDGEVAMVRLDAGSLEGIRRPDRLKVLSLSPLLAAPGTLRLGVPSGRRSNLLFACGAPGVAPPGPAGAWRIETLSGDAYRLVRDSSFAVPWPDTLLVRLFDDVADQEIALERGELDVAVFWPGEPSAHLRESPLWDAGAHGRRARGLLAAVTVGNDTALGPPAAARGAPDFEALDRQVFRGDLALPVTPGWAVGVAGPETRGARVVVDGAMPGRSIIERFFATRSGAARDSGAAAVHLFYLDVPAQAPDSVARALAAHVAAGAFPAPLRARADSLLRAAHGEPAADGGDTLARSLRALDAQLLFAIACPVACRPALRPLVAALGPGPLADILACPGGGRR